MLYGAMVNESVCFPPYVYMQDSWTKTGVQIYINFPFQKTFKWAGYLTFAIFLPCRTTSITYKASCRKPTASRSKIGFNCAKFRTRQPKTRSTGLQLACLHWLFTRIKPRPPNENETVMESSDFIEAQTCSRCCSLRVKITLRISYLLNILNETVG